MPSFRILCNPWIFAHAHALFFKIESGGSNSEYQEILASLMDYLSLADGDVKIQTVFVKLPIFCMPQGSVINKIFPTVNQICIAGHTQSSINSLFKVKNFITLEYSFHYDMMNYLISMAKFMHVLLFAEVQLL